jgi:hypothetical protein
VAGAPAELRLRLIRDSDAPATNPDGDPFEFGLQDAKQRVFAGTRDAAGRLAWDFTVTVKPGKDGAPNFTGAFASGPADDRFVYLSWRSIPRGVWINRIKARLGGIDWALIERASAESRRLVADMSGWTPHDGRGQVEWRLE